jgi:hypothetical protein
MTLSPAGGTAFAWNRLANQSAGAAKAGGR